MIFSASICGLVWSRIKKNWKSKIQISLPIGQNMCPMNGFKMYSVTACRFGKVIESYNFKDHVVVDSVLLTAVVLFSVCKYHFCCALLMACLGIINVFSCSFPWATKKWQPFFLIIKLYNLILKTCKSFSCLMCIKSGFSPSIIVCWVYKVTWGAANAVGYFLKICFIPGVTKFGDTGCNQSHCISSKMRLVESEI